MSENILVGIDMATVDSEFEAWWESDGQYCRSGGGSYEKTFAYRAYEAAIAKANGFFAPMVPGYTAVDMANAARDGFMDGRKSVGLLLSKGFNTLGSIGGQNSINLSFKDADNAFAAYTEIATVCRLAGE